MNLPANPSPVQLPAHLAALSAKNNIAAAVTGGIVAGGAFHSIGIKAARWRLNDPQGQEIVVPQHHLDVIILDGNPNLSRRYYAGAYDPNVEARAPDCLSDNGIAPSMRAAKPQSVTCAQCPHNVLGSKLNPNGSQSKACAQTKILAVLLAENPTGAVYQLQVPYMSQKNLKSFGDSVNSRGIPLPGLVVRLSFDTSTDYPCIIFTPLEYTTLEQHAAVLDVVDSEEVHLVTNKNDQPIKALPSANPAQGSIAHHQQQAAPLPPAAQTTLPQPMAAVNQVEPVKRTRRTKAEIAAAQAAPSAPAPQAALTVAPPDSGDFFSQLRNKTVEPSPVKPAAQASQIQVNPQPTNAALDALLENAFKV